MMYRTCASQRGFSLVKVLLVLALLAVVVLYFLPYIGGDTLSIINQISGKVKVIINSLLSKLSGIGDKFSGTLESYSTRISRTLAEWSDRWNLKKFSKLISGVEEEWEEDMQQLISISRSRGFDMSRVERQFDEYQARESSWRRVENTYWEHVREQTQQEIIISIEQFRTRPLGCSDFVFELRTIWEISENFNQDTLEGYIDAKQLSEKLQQPRSIAFLEEFLNWLAVANMYPFPGNWNDDWFIQQLQQAIPAAVEGTPPDYPAIIRRIDDQMNRTSHPIYCILGNLTIAEIYLNYDLINPAEDRFDEAIRQLSEIVGNYQQTYNMTGLGLHMALGLLHERVCKNADLAKKEFKEVIAIARRLGLRCQDYSAVHYHLGILYMDLRTTPEMRPIFEEAQTRYSGTTQELLAPTPTPTPSPTPTPKPDPIEVTIKIPRSRDIEEGARPERPTGGTVTPTPVITPVLPTAVPTQPQEINPIPRPTPTSYPGVIKGTIPEGAARRPERDIRLRPRPELGPSTKMKEFNIGDLYDLTNIPDDAAREFELYLRCHAEGERAIIARFIHDRYLGK